MLFCRRFKNLKRDSAAIRSQLRLYSNWQSNIPAGYVAGLESVDNWAIEILEDAHNDLLKRIALVRGSGAAGHFSKNDSANSVESARHAQLHEHAVDAVRFLANVLKEQQCVVGLNLELRPE